jgi:hypothetical protein
MRAFSRADRDACRCCPVSGPGGAGSRGGAPRATCSASGRAAHRAARAEVPGTSVGLTQGILLFGRELAELGPAFAHALALLGRQLAPGVEAGARSGAIGVAHRQPALGADRHVPLAFGREGVPPVFLRAQQLLHRRFELAPGHAAAGCVLGERQRDAVQDAGQQDACEPTHRLRLHRERTAQPMPSGGCAASRRTSWIIASRTASFAFARCDRCDRCDSRFERQWGLESSRAVQHTVLHRRTSPPSPRCYNGAGAPRLARP